MYTPLTIANEIIALQPGRSAMGYNKLVYLVHGWSLAYDHPILGELPEVWRYGPVYASLYEQLRECRDRPIHSAQPIKHSMTTPRILQSDDKGRQIIVRVCEAYRHLTDLQLSSYAHAEGSPWQLEAQSLKYKVPVGHSLPEWRIHSYFKGLLSARPEKMAA